MLVIAAGVRKLFIGGTINQAVMSIGADVMVFNIGINVIGYLVIKPTLSINDLIINSIMSIIILLFIKKIKANQNEIEKKASSE